MKKANPLLSLPAIAYFTLASLGCAKTDSLGAAGSGGTRSGGATSAGGRGGTATGGASGSGGTATGAAGGTGSGGAGGIASGGAGATAFGGSGVAASGGAGGSATGGSPGSGGILGSGGTAGVSSTGGSSSGGAGKDAGGGDRGNADSTTAVFCDLADGRRIEAGAVFADADGCNCCVCKSDGTASCQAAMCIWKNDASSVPSPCQTDQDCAAQGRTICVFDPGCTSPRGTCMNGPGICPTSAISDMAPFAYCGCDGVTYNLQSTKQYPDRPYSHVGGCPSGGTGGTGGSGGTGTGGAGGSATGGSTGSGGIAGSGGDGGVSTGDAGASDASADCASQPLTQEQATALYRDFVYQDTPTYNPDSVFTVEEFQVPGAWDAMGIQLFSGGYVDEFGYAVYMRPFVTLACKLYPLTKRSATGLLSAVLVGNTLYYTVRAGSGINYTELGRISLSGSGLEVLQGADYASGSNLYLRESAGQIVVELGDGMKFNSWTTQGVSGWLRDDGSIVVVVDSAGQVIPYAGVGIW